MGYKLRKREFDYCSPQFTGLLILKKDIVGCNYSQALELINTQCNKLALQFHPDKARQQIEAVGGSEEEIKALEAVYTKRIQAINGHKAELLKYIKPLRTGKNLIVEWEIKRYEKLTPQNQKNWDNKRTKYCSIVRSVALFLAISLTVSAIYLGVMLFIAANVTTIPSILFSATLLTAATAFLLSYYVSSPVAKKNMDLKVKLQKLDENLTQKQIEEIEEMEEDIEETLHKRMSEHF